MTSSRMGCDPSLLTLTQVTRGLQQCSLIPCVWGCSKTSPYPTARSVEQSVRSLIVVATHTHSHIICLTAHCNSKSQNTNFTDWWMMIVNSGSWMEKLKQKASWKDVFIGKTKISCISWFPLSQTRTVNVKAKLRVSSVCVSVCVWSCVVYAYGAQHNTTVIILGFVQLLCTDLGWHNEIILCWCCVRWICRVLTRMLSMWDDVVYSPDYHFEQDLFLLKNRRLLQTWSRERIEYK